ncbi:NB-ARC domain-containing protein [Argonema galeatum]|uniref:NB-ARC domain-containing protein n=1 Tax=Argonema galeatum TaxID=2942762 RepID=UPI00201331B4|nr:NB-ARC domain-containing protein [Argonema galeatum]MCL1468358.1 hypothetical protein [Argonema galeatum A003/A1]
MIIAQIYPAADNMSNENWQGINIKDGNNTINNPQINIHSSKPIEPIKYIPYVGVANFVGRQAELQTLHQELQKSDRVVISAVAGMGGVGKTELAIKYAREHEQDYPGGICWLTARDEKLATNILLLAQPYLKLKVPQKFGEKPLTLKEQVNWCWQNWQPPEEAFLLVLDDVTNWKSCRDFLPKINRFRILITTRLRNLDSNFVELPLDVLSPDKTLELLTALVGERRVQRELQTATELCKWLGYLPLGLELVGRYLVEDPDLSLAEMLERLKEKRLSDEAINPSDEQLQDTEMTAKRGVKAAFELSWQELDTLTQPVTAFLSLFAPDVFVWEWVECEPDLFNCPKSDINEAKKQLLKRHLMQRVKEIEAGYKIHPLIREFLQLKLSELQEAEKFRQSFVARFVKFAKKIPERPTLDDIESVKLTIPHLVEVTQNLINVVTDEDLISPFIGLGRFYEVQAYYPIAETWCQQGLSVTKSRLGEEHFHVATCLSYLAFLNFAQARFWKATLLWLPALRISTIALGSNHPKTKLRRISLFLTLSVPIFLGLYYAKSLWDLLLHPSFNAFLKFLIQVFLLWVLLKKGFLLDRQFKKIRWVVSKQVLSHPNTVIFRNNLALACESIRRLIAKVH